MIVTKISNESISTLTLPQKVKGQYWIYESADSTERLLSIEASDDSWQLRSNRNVQVTDDDLAPVRSAVLEPLHIYSLKRGEDMNTIVFTEPITDDRQIFTKYLVRDDAQFLIGRSEDCDILFRNPFVSSAHARLSFTAQRWHISDLGSTNGTFVNEKRITETDLEIGDTVFIMGFRAVVGKNFIAFNDPDGSVTVTDRLVRFIRQPVEPAEDDEYELAEQESFYISPRFKKDIETAAFRIDSPPQSPVGEEMPFILVAGSSIAMGLMSAITLVNAIVSRNVTSAVMGGAMLVGSLFLPLITKKYEKRRKHKKEELRQKKYREYLAEIEVSINETCRVQEEILRENIVPVGDCEDRILRLRNDLWDRSRTQNDFLLVRVGTGEGRLDAEISCAERKFSLNDDNLEAELYDLCDRPKLLHNIPISYSLKEKYVSGIVSDSDRLPALADGIIFQLAALYSSEEVKFVFIYDEEYRSRLEYVKWLPHVWDSEKRTRYIASDINELKELNVSLESIVSSRLSMNEQELEDVMPYYIVFSMSRRLFVRSEMIRKILGCKNNIGFSIVTFNKELRELPKECSMVVEIDGMSGKLYDKNDVSGSSIPFLPDIFLDHDPRMLAVKLANVVSDDIAGGFKLPATLTFLEMFGVGKVEHLNALARWKENDPTKSLGAAVGVDALGDTFVLDLHEKFHGPHGLVAGMTGSGKSEFIITFILSLAVNFHPNEVAFILIDYKGGGMAKSFEKLPHTAGIITNLDGSAIKRSLISIESELKRRQSIFADVSRKLGISNIDIYKYQKLYREGTVSEPLQHLFIISDEFAELKTQQPEFMTQLVSAARIGRSLGVHLILATQKPSGVVDDQIWSNSRFKVCLKVQERADSMDMLKCPDAAELSDTGRFYLQVGYNELFELGQSAWAGAPYIPSDKPFTDKARSVSVIDRCGHTIRQAKIDRNQHLYAGAKKQLDAITAYLTGIADEENIRIRPLWLDPIPAVILIDSVKEKYGAVSKPYVLEPVIGEYDDPVNQRQCLLRLPISEEGNAVVFGTQGSGKTSFINAMLHSLISGHTPEEVNIYILDFASETLRAFAGAPHVGDVMLSYEDEKIGNLIKMLTEQIKKRKKLFADHGGDYASYISSGAGKVPSLVVVINGYTAFRETYQEHSEFITLLAREGVKYGIYFVITSLSIAGVGFRMMQNFKQLISLQLNDSSEYASIVGKTDGLYPSACKGRGLIKLDRIYEFQTAFLTEEKVPFGFIREFCRKANADFTGKKAQNVPVLPERVDAEFLSSYIDTAHPLSIPVGVEKESMNVLYYPFGNDYANQLLSQGEESGRLAADICDLLASHLAFRGYVLDMPGLAGRVPAGMKLCTSESECIEAVDALFDSAVERNNNFKDAAEGRAEARDFEPLLIVVTSLSRLYEVLSDEGQQKLDLILEKGRTEYKMNVIFAEREDKLPALKIKKWYRMQLSAQDGIWAGPGFASQYYLTPVRSDAQTKAGITEEYGFALQKGRAVLIKLLKSEREDDPNG
ncbi:MAG: type VII secretion protein EssC [Ruminococcus sp.]|nr:type VII secretion protein EssC [Ruminococcus sp.]